MNSNDYLVKLLEKYSSSSIVNWSRFIHSLSIDYILKNDKNWDVQYLSHHPELTLDIVLNNMNIKWNWSTISGHKNIKMIDIENHPELPWDYNKLHINPNLTLEFVEKNIDKDWDWYNLSSHKIITFNFYKKYFFKYIDKTHWNIYKLLQNIIPIDYVEEYCYFFHALYHSLDSLSQSPLLTIEFVEKYIDKNGWNMFYLTTHKIITLDFIKKYPYKNWDINRYIHNPNFKIEDVQNNPDINWDWTIISQCMNLDTILKNLDKPWDWYNLSRNKNINNEFVERNLDKPWNWYLLIRNDSISWNFIEKYLDFILDKYKDSENITLNIYQEILLYAPLSFIQRNKYKIPNYYYWYYLSSNTTLPLNFISKNINKFNIDKFYIDNLSKNPIITPEFILKNEHIDWNLDVFFDQNTPKSVKIFEYDNSSFFKRHFLYLIDQRRIRINRKNTLKLAKLKNILPTDILLKIGNEYLWK